MPTKKNKIRSSRKSNGLSDSHVQTLHEIGESLSSGNTSERINAGTRLKDVANLPGLTAALKAKFQSLGEQLHADGNTHVRLDIAAYLKAGKF